MDLKNAVAVCLISLFSATLVVLVARAIDSRQSEQLEQIAAELRAIREGGAVVAGSGGSGAIDAIDDGLVVYYFHNSQRCPTCRAIESQARDVVESDFGEALDSGQIVWKVLNYEKPGARELALEFGVDKPVVVLARMKDGQIETRRRLDRVWALWNEGPAFAEFVRGEIDAMLAESDVPAEDEPSDIPVPEDTKELPVPEQ